MRRLIDANEVLQRNEEAYKKVKTIPAENFVSVLQYHTVREMVNSSPTVDAVEVVRCKDCKYYKPRCQSVQWNATVLCCARSAALKFPPKGFCSYGERKDNG